MNDHPQELLAGYVDGTLSATERDAVDAHLASCATCGGEIQLAARVRSALGELAEVPVPVGVTRPILQADPQPVSLPAARGRSFATRFGGLAVAATIVLLFAIAYLPKLGGGGGHNAVSTAVDGGGQTGAKGGPAASAPAESQVRSVDVLQLRPGTNFDGPGLETLAEQAASGGIPIPAGVQAASQEDSTAAKTCVESAAQPGPDDALVALIGAKFNGKPAYIGVYLSSPGAAQPADQVHVWALSRDGCTILSFTTFRF